MWRPDSLKESIAEGASFIRDRHGRYQCPSCRTLRNPAVIVDVRSLPIPEDWACDVCWTHWERIGRVVDGGDKIAGRLDWRLRWVVAHDAPQSIINKFSSLSD